MELIRLTCQKIIERNTIPHFNENHTRALLCFSKHAKLDLPQASLILDLSLVETKKILQKLASLKLLRAKQNMFFMPEVFDSLYTLVQCADSS